MPTAVTTITKAFTFNIADEIFGSTATNNLTADASYTGPDRIWVFVNTDDGVLNRQYVPLTNAEDGSEVPVPPGTTRVLVTAEDNILQLAMLKENCVTYADITKQTEALPAGYGSVEYNTKATLSETHSISELTYDIANSAWLTCAWLDDEITWDDIINSRNGMLTASDGKISSDMPDAIKNPWIAYRTALRNLPAAYNYGEANQTDAWKVQLPLAPEDGGA